MFENIKGANQPLTIEKLRTFQGCADYSDKDATQIIESLKQLAEILFSISYCIDNQLNVYLNHDTGINTPDIDLENTKPLPHEFDT